MTITLDDIKTEHHKVAEMIAKFEAKAKVANLFPLTINAPAARPGEQHLGIIISADGSKHEHIFLLAGTKEDVSWQDAMEWAKSIGGDLPNRCESALLFATMKDQFKPVWHWTNEQYAGNAACAWVQGFGYGNQDGSRKSDEYSARAVRRESVI
ncbi:DUF1566 domain-containing protein [Undibacterium sp. RTI2.1]|uniref:DUF1566 domain-containing protein n=1 Tax=unclassified Undibacterium TaxID=2630295 RepID=UPI002B23308C|nr:MULTISPECIES: DUF1566 domain-containing protein [unclassified Undibacterium]MEB0029250.1 DUF1566 domain-containing protein [Undibacterium sp. RTI2.1]MEB0115558.1 DUF1566 domain-containing protein [Undibacterium sp. RTI2.2]